MNEKDQWFEMFKTHLSVLESSIRIAFATSGHIDTTVRDRKILFDHVAQRSTVPLEMKEHERWFQKPYPPIFIALLEVLQRARCNQPKPVTFYTIHPDDYDELRSQLPPGLLSYKEELKIDGVSIKTDIRVKRLVKD
jgi:hypothetical protein